LLIGIAQLVALVPGVSRSGSTITAGVADRFNRGSASVFGLLMRLPVITQRRYGVFALYRVLPGAAGLLIVHHRG